jgi:hypothetical protein
VWLQSGVAYSALLVVFFLPARCFLDWLLVPLVPVETRTDAEARKKWLVTHDLAGSWQDDARQLLALLAPVISALRAGMGRLGARALIRRHCQIGLR